MDQEQTEATTTPSLKPAMPKKSDYAILLWILLTLGLVAWGGYNYTQAQGWKEASWKWKEASEAWQQAFEGKEQLQHSHELKNGA